MSEPRRFGRRRRGEAVAPCPLRNGDLYVTVTRSDNGHGLAGATVTIEGAGEPASRVTTRAGSASFRPCRVGAWAITARLSDQDAGDFEAPTPGGVEVVANGQRFADLVAHPFGAVVVEVVRAGNNAPIANVNAHVRGPNNREPRLLAVRESPTDPQGSAAFLRAPRGRYVARVDAPGGYAPAASQQLDVGPGARVVARFTLAPRATLAVTVKRGDTQAPIQGVTVQADAGHGVLSKVTDARGVADFGAVPAGAYTIRPVLQGTIATVYRWAGPDPTRALQDDGAAVALDLVLAALPTLKVKARSTVGAAPVADAKVTVTRHPATQEKLTAGDGLVTFAGLDAGDWDVALAFDGDRAKRWRVRGAGNPFPAAQLPARGDTVLVERDVEPRALTLGDVDAHFAPGNGREQLEVHYTIKGLDDQVVTLEVTSDQHPQAPLYRRALTLGEKADADDAVLRWDGLVNAGAGPLSGGNRYINPLYGPYKVKLTSALGHDGGGEKTFHVLYHSVTLALGTYTADGAAPPALQAVAWAKYKLNELGYFAGPVDANVDDRLRRAVKRYSYDHAGAYAAGKETDDHADGALVLQLTAGENARVILARASDGAASLPNVGDTAKLFLDHDYFYEMPPGQADEFGIPQGHGIKDRAKLDPVELPLEARVLLVSRADDGSDPASVGVDAPEAVGDVDVRFFAKDPAEDLGPLPTNKPANANVPSPVREYVKKALEATRKSRGAPGDDNCPTDNHGTRTEGTDDERFHPGAALPPFDAVVAGRKVFVPCHADPVTHPAKRGRAAALFRGSHVAGDRWTFGVEVSFSRRGVAVPHKDVLVEAHQSHFRAAPARARSTAAECLTRETGALTLWRRHHVAAVVQWPASGAVIQWVEVADVYRHAYCELVSGGVVAQTAQALFPAGPARTALLDFIHTFTPGWPRPAMQLRADGFFPWNLPAQGMAESNADYAERVEGLMDAWSNRSDANGQMVEQVGQRIAARLREASRAGTAVWGLRWCPVAIGGLYCMGLPSGVVLMDNEMTVNEQHGFLYAHEMSHCRYLKHHETSRSRWLRGLLRIATYDNRGEHDLNDHNCTMCYPDGVTSRPGLTWDQGDATEARFCGKCNLKLRGWKVLEAGLPKQS